MSLYGYWACADCRQLLFLGKAIRRDDGSVVRFKFGPEEAPPNSVNSILTRVLWKLLADHCGHNTRTIFDGEWPEGWPDEAEFVRIGGDRTIDVPSDDFLSGWNG